MSGNKGAIDSLLHASGANDGAAAEGSYQALLDVVSPPQVGWLPPCKTSIPCSIALLALVCPDIQSSLTDLPPSHSLLSVAVVYLCVCCVLLAAYCSAVPSGHTPYTVKCGYSQWLP